MAQQGHDQINIIIYYRTSILYSFEPYFIEACSKRTLIYELNAKYDIQPLRYGPRHDDYPFFFFFLMDFINVNPN